jgi:hypothetical protein
MATNTTPRDPDQYETARDEMLDVMEGTVPKHALQRIEDETARTLLREQTHERVFACSRHLESGEVVDIVCDRIGETDAIRTTEMPMRPDSHSEIGSYWEALHELFRLLCVCENGTVGEVEIGRITDQAIDDLLENKPPEWHSAIREMIERHRID